MSTYIANTIEGGSGLAASVPAPAEGSAPASHMVALPGTDWCLWRTIAVRGAGFPARIVGELEAPRASAAADTYLAAAAHASNRIGGALRGLAADIRTGSVTDRRRLRAVRRRILAGQPVEAGDGVDACAAAAASAAAGRAGDIYRAAYRADTDAIHERLTALSREPRFREAMLWQSAEAARRIQAALQPGSRPRYRRHALAQMAMRVQRYSVKNDTIGFFGPRGWASVDERAARIEVTPGPDLTDWREVFFEGWTIDTLASCLDADNPLRPWLSPRIKSGVWIHDSRAYRPLRKTLPLSEAEMAVLAMCDGIRTAEEIAQAMPLPAPAATLAPAAAVFEILEHLVAADIISWRLDPAPQVYPERELSERLARIGDPVLRDRCVGALDHLLHARAAVAAAAGRPDDLDSALAALDSCFTRLTVQPASRRGGQTYAGRTLVYEDCRRDCDVRVGPSLVAELAQPLGIMLDAARWISVEVGEVLRDELRVRLAELQTQHGAEIDCHQFLAYVMATVWMHQRRATLFDATLQRFQQTWAGVLGGLWDLDDSRVVLPLDEVSARAAQAFPPREVTWGLGWYVSPDLQIAANSVAAIRRGEYCAVLGEVHVGNTMGTSTYTTQHPNPRELFAAAAADMAGETVVLRSFPRPAWIARTNYGLVLPHYWRYMFGDDPPCHPRCRELPAGQLIVVDTGATVVAQARHGSLRFDAVELFANSLMDEAGDMVSDFRPRLPHLPRLVLGNLTLARERWNLVPGDMPFRHVADPAQQFVELRAWRHERGMPRRVFVKCPAERKPWFLDFDSPVYVEIFAAMMRKLPEDAAVSITEMLPDLHQLWLQDRNDERFTSELRCVTRPAVRASRRSALHGNQTIATTSPLC